METFGEDMGRWSEGPETTEEIVKTEIPMQVKDLMTTDLFTLHEEDNLKVLEEVMKWKKVRHIPVVDKAGHLVGLVTHRDLLQVSVSCLSDIVGEERDALNQAIKVSDIMRKRVLSVPEKTPLRQAAKLMYQNKIGCLPVIKEGKLSGIITEADFVKFFIYWDVLLTEAQNGSPGKGTREETSENQAKDTRYARDSRSHN